MESRTRHDDKVVGNPGMKWSGKCQDPLRFMEVVSAWFISVWNSEPLFYQIVAMGSRALLIVVQVDDLEDLLGIVFLDLPSLIKDLKEI